MSTTNAPIRAWRVHYELLEPLFFASRELGTIYLCEPLLSSYGQPYALGWVESPYRLVGVDVQRPKYEEHLTPLNEHQIYLTPAAPVGAVRFRMERFNAMLETYWSRMDNGAVAGNLENRFRENKNGPIRLRAINRPQQGQFRLVAAGTCFESTLFSPEKPHINPYCRLGKFMSKAIVTVQSLGTLESKDGNFTSAGLINPADLPENISLLGYDLLNVRPVPLLQKARMKGPFWTNGTLCWPRGMEYRFAFPRDQKKGKKKKKSAK